MSRVLIGICVLVLASAGGRAAAQTNEVLPKTYTAVSEVDHDIQWLNAFRVRAGSSMAAAQAACDRQEFERQKELLLEAVRIQRETLGRAKVSSSREEAIRLRMEGAAVAAAIAAEGLPAWRSCGGAPPADPPKPVVAAGGGGTPAARPADPASPPPPKPEPVLPGGYLSPTAAGRARLPDGVLRPALLPVATLVLPARFCTERERVDMLERVYRPEVEKANANARAAVAYQGRITAEADAHMRKGDGVTWGELLAEHKAYQPIMDAELANARTMGDLYANIMAIPVADCGQVAEVSPPKPPVARVDGSRPVQVADSGRRAKEDCPPQAGREPITVGPNSKMGSGARFKSKAASTALGIAGGLLGGGGSPLGGRGRGGDGPPMVNCRIKDSEMTVFDDPATGTVLKVGVKRAKDTLVVFAKIDRSSDNGTFQTAFLQKSDGAALAPASVGICDLWGEWKLTVSWTRDTYVDNQLVKHEQGGWSEGGRFALPGFVSTAERPDGLWRRLGFSNASHGARMVALSYKVPPDADLDLVVHVTRPSQEMVTTTPFALTLTEGPKGVGVSRAGPAACPPDRTPPPGPPVILSGGDLGPKIAGGEVAPVTSRPSPRSEPKPTPGVCGPDVTDAYLRELALVWMRIQRLKGDEKGIYDGTAFLERNGMSVDATPAALPDECPLGPCAGEGTERKQPCFMLFGVCTPRHVFNDLLFGVLGEGLGVPLTIQQLGGHYADIVNYGALDPYTSQKAYEMGGALADLLDSDDVITRALVEEETDWLDFVEVIRREYPFTADCIPCPNPTPGRILKSFARADWKLEDDKIDRFGPEPPSGGQPE